jgi:hypothetical protein
MTQFEDNLWGTVVDRHGDDLARADAPIAPRTRPARLRWARPRLLAGATAAVAASATAVTLLSVTTSSPAFAVTRHHDGSVTLKVNRTTTVADVNRKLSAMGIEKISQRTVAARADSSSIPRCSSIPPGWKGKWILTYGEPAAGSTGAGGNVGPGVWRLAICTPDSLASTGSGNTGAG